VVCPKSAQRSQDEPNANNHDSGDAACRSYANIYFVRPNATFGHDVGRDHPDSNDYAEWNQQQVI
jgi:hypothetical protein